MSKYTTNRRQYLKTALGVSGTALIAGCTGDGGSGDGGDGGDGSDGDDGGSGDGGSGNGGDGGSGDGGDGGDGGSEYPSGEVENIVPYVTGGGFDAYARLTEPYWSEYLDTDVVTRNVAGGGGVTAGTQLMNAEPDGHQIMIWAPGEALPSQIGQDVDYDIREMSHIGFVTQTPCAIILRSGLGIDTWDDLASNMADLNWATQGVGTMAHVGLYIMAELTGSFSPDQVNFVHYGGTGEVLAGLERNEANAFLITAGDSGANVVQSIDTELFLVFSEPDTYGSFFEEQGVEVGHWGSELDVDGMEQMGTVAGMSRFYTGPPGVPEDVLSVQREAFQNIINDQDFIDEAAEAGRPVLEPAGPEAVDEVIQESYDLLTSEPYKSTLEDAFSS